MSNWEESKHPRDSEGKFTDKGQGTPAERKRLEEMGDHTKTNNKANINFREIEKTIYKNKIRLEKDVDAVLDGNYKDSHITILEETPKVLQNVGVPNKPILMTSKHAYLAINKEGKYTGENDHYHDLGKDTFLLIPGLLQSPMMVLQSNKIKDEVITILNWYDKDKNILIVPIKLNGKGNKNYIEIEANIAKSVYGRKNFENYINKNFTQNDILFAGNKKIRDLNQ